MNQTLLPAAHDRQRALLPKQKHTGKMRRRGGPDLARATPPPPPATPRPFSSCLPPPPPPGSFSSLFSRASQLDCRPPTRRSKTCCSFSPITTRQLRALHDMST